jgi:dihydroorotate dehydrogenase
MMRGLLTLLYTLWRPVLFLLDAETAHHLTFGALRFAVRLPGVRALLRSALVPKDPVLAVEVFGETYPSPVGLAAGFDKDAVGVDALGALGFGFLEVGTLTARAQPGNPRPRLFRLPEDRALINRLGFNNGGSEAAVPRLVRPRPVPLGVNIGKSKVTPEAEAFEDYALSTRRVAAHADYLVVNVSSPNTPGLRDLQAVEKLRPILAAVLEAAGPERPPVLVKIAPDLSDEDVDAVADLALDLALDGIVATNTTIRREPLRSDPRRVEALGNGGLSGPVLKARALEVLRRLRARVGDRLVLIAVGGIETGADAWARIRAGATLVQLYTGFVYGGPTAPSDIARDLAALAKEAGYARVQDAVGTE